MLSLIIMGALLLALFLLVAGIARRRFTPTEATLAMCAILCLGLSYQGAFAQAATVTSPDAPLNLGPFVAYFGPVIGNALNVVVGAILGYLGLIIKRYAAKLDINVTDDMWAVVERTAQHWAEQWWASEETRLATATISIGDQRVAYWANLAIKDIPDIAKKLGLTPQKMQEYVIAALGRLQNKATSVTVPVNPQLGPGK